MRIRLPRCSPSCLAFYTLNVFSTVNGEIADWLLPAIMINVATRAYYYVLTGRDYRAAGTGTFVSEHSFALLMPDI